MRLFSAIAILILILGACTPNELPLTGKTIVLDPGHGGTAEVDTFRVGPAGEREEWINLRVANDLEQLLQERGAEVLMTRTDDSHVDLADRASLAVDNNADLFLSIHHNATADPEVNFPIVYFHGNQSENRAGARLAELMGRELRATLFDGEGPLVVASDLTIFPNSGTGVLRRSYGIPGVITEASFFTNPEEEQRLLDPRYIRGEAEALLRAIEAFFTESELRMEEPFSRTELPTFSVFQEAERMSPEAMRWRENFERAAELFQTENEEELERAYEYATKSVRSFPDSPVAREAHLLRADILVLLGRGDEAEVERTRAEEFYIPID
ncbi:MAG: N-acetylmuramoyl-L-alanine amidase [Balneolaceae bacterium]|nr:N-acetylmuramoyl-L-alanine amidase [Balneolaceae bacterium]MCH8547775.1 N-acetylmuramoyl-L-alanine amidase [Balneolaceae bacterium]